MAPSRTVIVAGAGIGGLTASLALAQRGLRAVVLEQAPRLEETGAGIQLSPNATRVLIALGLGERLRREVVAPEAVEVHAAGGRRLAAIPLGAAAAERYGAPYWTVHRADLQRVLAEAATAAPDVTLKLGTRVEDFVTHRHGLTAACRRGPATADESGIALVAADGLWSALRARLGQTEQPMFRQRTAWRALIPADRVETPFREAKVHLWLGRDAHVVHYPVKNGALVNVVAIVRDVWDGRTWSEPGEPRDLMARFARRAWSGALLALLGAAERWQKWALHDLPPLRRWSEGPVALLGDAAHPALPFLAQGAALAIEDAAVLARSLADRGDDIPAAMRAYEAARRTRTLRVQKAARANSRTYHLAGAEALARNLAMRMMGGSRLLRRYDWLYGWAPPDERAGRH